MTDFIEKQRAEFSKEFEGPRLVPTNIFLPKHRTDALRMIAALLYSIRDDALRLDFVTSAYDEITEVIDLIERS